MDHGNGDSPVLTAHAVAGGGGVERDEAVERPCFESLGVVAPGGERLVDDRDRPPDQLEGGVVAAAGRLSADGLGDGAARLADDEGESGVEDLEQR